LRKRIGKDGLSFKRTALTSEEKDEEEESLPITFLINF
jgi:hypothetical protein